MQGPQGPWGMSSPVSLYVTQSMDSLNLPSTTLVTFVAVRDDFLVDTLASAAFAVSAWCCLDELMPAGVFMHHLDAHRWLWRR